MDEPQKKEEVKVETPAADAPKPEASKPEESKEQAQKSAPTQAANSGSTPPKKKNFFQNKALLFGVIGLLVIALIGGGYFFIAGRTASTQEEETTENTDVVETLSADQLGLSISAKPDKQAVKFKIEKAGDIKTIEYQVTYEADSTAQEKAEGGEERVQRGITGEAEVKGGATVYESEWLDLGSCSRNVCKYDKGVKTVDLTLKILKKNGKTYEAQDTLEL